MTRAPDDGHKPSWNVDGASKTSEKTSTITLDRLTLIVVNYSSSHLLKRLIASVPAQVEIVIVDNFSTMTERSNLIGSLSGRATIACRTNEGFAAGVNAANALIEKSRWIMVANPDAWFAEGALKQLLTSATAHDLDVAAPTILDGTGSSVWFAGGAVHPRTFSVTHAGYKSVPDTSEGISPTGFVTGCMVLISPRARKALLPMDTQFFMYFEDVDLSLAARAAGLRLGVVRHSVAFHDEGQSSGGKGVERSSLYYFYQARNRWLVGRKHGATLPLLVFSEIAISARYFYRILRDSHASPDHMKAWAKGVWDGVRGAQGRCRSY